MNDTLARSAGADTRPAPYDREIKVTLPSTLIRRIDHLKVDTGMTRSEIVRRVLEACLDQMHREAMA